MNNIREALEARGLNNDVITEAVQTAEAFKAAAKQGKIKPQDLDGFVFDTGRIIGASNGKKVTKIKIHINADGKGLHAFPFN